MAHTANIFFISTPPGSLAVVVPRLFIVVGRGLRVAYAAGRFAVLRRLL
jgi:hypothetical protein